MFEKCILGLFKRSTDETPNTFRNRKKDNRKLIGLNVARLEVNEYSALPLRISRGPSSF